MSSSFTLRNPNDLVVQQDDLLWAFNNPYALTIMNLLFNSQPLTMDTIENQLEVENNILEVILKRMMQAGLLKKNKDFYEMTLKTKKRLERQLMTADAFLGKTISGQSDNLKKPLQGTYHVKSMIGRGATSITFCAEQESTHKNRTLKVFLPHTVTISQIDTALARRVSIQSNCIPEIIEAGQIRIKLSNGNQVVVPCVVMRHVDSSAQTLDVFLESHVNISSYFLERFIEHVGGALYEMERANLQHGDLHDGNILVELASQSDQLPHFWVIDFVGVPSTGSPELELPSDMDSFRNHLLRAALIACNCTPGYSARLLLGERVFRILQSLRQKKYRSFGELLEDYHRDATSIPDDYFTKPAPSPFEWLRVEFIPDSSWLYRLFEPMESWFNIIAKFGNICISGPRGCGKSHYLRVLAFQPEAILLAENNVELQKKFKMIDYDFHRLFGILFACRLGEFKVFAPEAMGMESFDADTILFLKHILVLKIWNKTLSTLLEGIATVSPVNNRPILTPPATQEALKFVHFISSKLGNIAGIDTISGTSILRQVTAICIARENSAAAVWHRPEKRGDSTRLNEQDLHDFFSVIKQCCPDLRNAQFAILVDDATAGHMCFEYQRILNSLIRASQNNHCFKLTHEKYRYTLESTDGRPIDPRNELEYVDLGETSVRSQRRRSKSKLSDYMTRVVNRRLKAAEYQPDIVRLLGQSQKPEVFLSSLAPPTKRKMKALHADVFEVSDDSHKDHAMYAGWNIIWQLSHGSIRTLLEIIEEIFRDANVTQNTEKIPLEVQDVSVRNYSVRKFRALSLLSGEIKGKPLGEALQDVLGAIGEISWRYLTTYDTGTDKRWYETISVDRNEKGALDEEAFIILKELLKNDLLMAEGMNYSRSQVGLGVRYDLNKIFTPAFRATYRVRNHLYVSNAKFAQLLTYPGQFVRLHSRKLKELCTPPKSKNSQKGLFDE